MQNNDNTGEWVSVSTLARQLGVSTQTIYNRIKSGVYVVHTYERGKMKGILIHYDSINNSK